MTKCANYIGIENVATKKLGTFVCKFSFKGREVDELSLLSV